LFSPSWWSLGRLELQLPQKNMTEKVDVAGELAYNTSLDDMDFRCFNSVAALAVLIGSGACAVFAPAARAGDRIDFSAPAIPLGIPQPEVEVKEPNRMIGSYGVGGGGGGGVLDGAGMAVPSQSYFVKPKTREKDLWGLEPLLGEDPDQRNSDDFWFTSRPDSSRATNGNRLNMQHGLNPTAPGNQIQPRFGSGTDGAQNDSILGEQNGFDGDNSRLGGKNGLDRDNPRMGAKYGSERDNLGFGEKNGLDRENSRFGAKNGMDRDFGKVGAKNGFDREYSKLGAQYGLDKDKGRPGDLLGRGFSGPDDISAWSKAFNHDAAGMDRFNAMRSIPSMSDGTSFPGGGYEGRMNNPWLGQDSAPTAAPPSYPGSTSLDDAQARPIFGEQAGEQAGESPVSFGAWGPSAPAALPPRTFSNPEALSRVGVPNRPAILAMPQRPGDPH
jgi:hypothetical protein